MIGPSPRTPDGGTTERNIPSLAQKIVCNSEKNLLTKIDVSLWQGLNPMGAQGALKQGIHKVS